MKSGDAEMKSENSSLKEPSVQDLYQGSSPRPSSPSYTTRPASSTAAQQPRRRSTALTRHLRTALGLSGEMARRRRGSYGAGARDKLTGESVGKGAEEARRVLPPLCLGACGAVMRGQEPW